MDPRDLVERCVEARRAYYAAARGTQEERTALDAFSDAALAIDRYIRDESTRRDMADRARRTASMERIPGDLASALIEDAKS